MRSSPDAASASEQPICADGGLSGPPRVSERPLDERLDLMELVEQLCPVWPPQDTFEGQTDFRL